MSVSPAPTLVLRGISTTYGGGVRALDDVSLTVGPGLFGLLGPNGAGKSTLMRTIATLQRADTGTLHFGDIDVLAEPQRLRALLGYLPQDFGLHPTLSAEVILDHFALLKGVTDRGERRALVDRLLVQVNLQAQRGKAVGGFSGGMRQRLGIAIALAGDPRLVVVDEPTAGLDPSERFRFLDLLAAIGEDVVVLLSTHIVADVEALCRRVAVLHRGRVRAEGEPAALVEAARGRVWRCTTSRDTAPALRARHPVISSRLVGGRVVLQAWADDAPGDGFVPVEPTLEDVYFRLVGEDPD